MCSVYKRTFYAPKIATRIWFCCSVLHWFMSLLHSDFSIFICVCDGECETRRNFSFLTSSLSFEAAKLHLPQNHNQRAGLMCHLPHYATSWAARQAIHSTQPFSLALGHITFFCFLPFSACGHPDVAARVSGTVRGNWEMFLLCAFV